MRCRGRDGKVGGAAQRERERDVEIEGESNVIHERGMNGVLRNMIKERACVDVFRQLIMNMLSGWRCLHGKFPTV